MSGAVAATGQPRHGLRRRGTGVATGGGILEDRLDRRQPLRSSRRAPPAATTRRTSSSIGRSRRPRRSSSRGRVASASSGSSSSIRNWSRRLLEGGELDLAASLLPHPPEQVEGALVGDPLGQPDIDQRPERGLAQAALADPRRSSAARAPRTRVLRLVPRSAPRQRVGGLEAYEGLQQGRAVGREEELLLRPVAQRA